MISFLNRCSSTPCNPILKTTFTYIVPSDKNGPVVYVGDDSRQYIQIKVDVANIGPDPSYTTTVFSSYPEAFLELDKDDNSAQVVRPGLVLCHIGNPLLGRSSASCLLKFAVLGEQLSTASENFTINSSVETSANTPVTSLSSMNNSLTVRVIMKLNVTLESEILPDAAYYSGNVSDGIYPNIGENKIGATRLLFRIKIQNLGKNSLLSRSRLVIDWPYEIAGNLEEDHGKYMLYMLETPHVIKSDSGTSVFCDSRVLDDILNPHNYRIFKSYRPAKFGVPVNTTIVDLPAKHQKEYPPLRTDTEISYLPEASDSNIKRSTTNLTCFNGLLRCKQLVCELGALSYRTGPVIMLLTARLWDNTMRQDFKDIFLTKLHISTTWRAMVSYAIDVEDKDFIANSVELQIFNNMDPEPIYPKNLPLYIGLAAFAGLILLAILILILWKAKFFERKKFKQRFQKGTPVTGLKSNQDVRTELLQGDTPSPPPELPSYAIPAQADPSSYHRPSKKKVIGQRTMHSPPLSAFGNVH